MLCIVVFIFRKLSCNLDSSMSFHWVTADALDSQGGKRTKMSHPTPSITSWDINDSLAADFDGSLSGLGTELGTNSYNMRYVLLFGQYCSKLLNICLSDKFSSTPKITCLLCRLCCRRKPFVVPAKQKCHIGIILSIVHLSAFCPSVTLCLFWHHMHSMEHWCYGILNLVML